MRSRPSEPLARRPTTTDAVIIASPSRSGLTAAELAAGAIVCAVVLVAELPNAIGFSSFAVLPHHAPANASACPGTLGRFATGRRLDHDT